VIGIDTNILARYLLRDDEEQFKLAAELFSMATEDLPIFVTHTTLIELNWLLLRTYRRTKEQFIAVLDKLIQMRQLVVENVAHVAAALHLFRMTNADFPDCMIMVATQQAGCTWTYSFDRKACKAGMTELIGPKVLLPSKK